jgi:hypothetical protein
VPSFALLCNALLRIALMYFALDCFAFKADVIISTHTHTHTHRLQQMETQFSSARWLRCSLRTRAHTHKPTSTLTLKHTKPFQATPSVFAQATHCHPNSSASTPQCFPPSIHQASPAGNTSRQYICNDDSAHMSTVLCTQNTATGQQQCTWCDSLHTSAVTT